MNDFIKYTTGARWEPIVGYSRAIRAGDVIEVSGTCAVDESGQPFATGDAYHQTKKILEIIINAIQKLGGEKEDIIRTRIFVTNNDDWESIGKAHGEIFHQIRPVTTMVEVSRLISPDYLVEIEASAVVRN